MNAKKADWHRIRLDLHLQRHLLRLLTHQVEQTKEMLPAGTFHPETDEPIDLAGCLEAQYALFDSEYLTGFQRDLDEAIGWLDSMHGTQMPSS